MYDTITLGKKIVYFRKQKNLSQADLAKQAATSQSNISNLENGKNKFNIAKLSNIADILETTLDILLFESIERYHNTSVASCFYDKQFFYLISLFQHEDLLYTSLFLNHFARLKCHSSKNT